MEKFENTRKIVVYDFFCGCGGTSRGFQQAGIDVAFALDTDPDAKSTFERNFPSAIFCHKSINDLEASDLEPILQTHKNSYKLFCGCAPCQPFTRQFTERAKSDSKRNLLAQFGVFVEKYKPDFVFVENVPGLQKISKHKNGPFPAFVELLKVTGYHIAYGVVAAQDYGAPQLRRRFVLLASKHGEITIPPPTHGNNRESPYQTVRHAIENLPVIAAGETCNDPNIPNHRASHLSKLNMRRIKASPHNGGGRNDWPKDLWPPCYTRPNKNGELHPGHTDCYGRLWWDKPATGLTTRCISYSNGRFGHPEQDRALSIREAARLQGFDDVFEFTGSMNSMARQIGNAVPVDLAYAMGKHFMKHIEDINGEI